MGDVDTWRPATAGVRARPGRSARRRLLATLLACLCVLGWAAGCAAPDDGPRPGADPADVPLAPDDPLPGPDETAGVRPPVSSPAPALQPLEWRNDPEAAAGAEQVLALLVAVDTYAADPGWNLPHARLSIDAVRDTLERTCHVAPDAIEQLSGSDVSRDAVESALLRLAGRARAERATLLVYWVGHGCVQAGEPRFFTHFSDVATAPDDDAPDEGPVFRATIGRDELVRDFVGEAVETASDADCALEVVFVADACRVNVAAPSVGAKLEPLGPWELYGTQAGRYAVAPNVGPLEADGSPRPVRERLSPFTRAFVDSLDRLDRAGRRADARSVFDETRVAMASDALNTSRQEPELLAPADAEPPAFVTTGPVRFSVRVVDQLEGVRVEGARVQLNARPPVSASTALEAAPGRHTLRVSAPGYLTRQQPFDVDRVQGGRLLEIPLLPEYVRVEGQVVPPLAVTVRLLGADDALRAGLHDALVATDAEGRFRMRTPRLGPDMALQIEQGERVLETVPLPERPDVYGRSDDGVLWGIGRVDLGSVLLPTEASQARLLRMAARDATGPLPLPAIWRDESALPLPEGLDEIDLRRWGLVMDTAADEQWEHARTLLARLGRALEPEVRAAWDGWFALRAAADADDPAVVDGLLAATDPADAPLVAALHAVRLRAPLQRLSARIDAGEIDALDDVTALSEQVPAGDDPALHDLREALHQRQLTLGARLVQRLLDERRWLDVLDVLERMGRADPWDDPEWLGIRRQVDVSALEAELLAGYENGIHEGDWQRADAALAWDDAFGADVLGSRLRVDDLRHRIADEHVPLWARRLFNEAQTDYALGRLEDAFAKYQRLDGQVTPYFQAKIDEQRRLVAKERFGALYSEAVEHEMYGRKAEAAAAYARALRFFDQRAADALLQQGVPVEGVRIVSSRGDRQYTRIGDALAAAKPGDAVVVGPGVYEETLVVSEDVRIHGASFGPDETGGARVELVGKGGPAIEVADGANVMLSGMSLRSEGAAASGRPRATLAEGAATLELLDCSIEPAPDGAAILARGTEQHPATLRLRGCRVPSADGVALQLDPSAVIELDETQIEWSTDLRHAPLVGEPLPERSHVRASRLGDLQLADVSGDGFVDLATRLSEAAAERHLGDGGPLVVSARSDGQPYWARPGATLFQSLGAALERVSAGGTIEVDPGLYAESLHPTRGVTLMRRGASGEVVVAPREGPALLLDSGAQVTVRGLQLTRSALRMLPDTEPTVRVAAGRLQLTDCVLERGVGVPALAIGSGAVAVTLEECTLPAGPGPGLSVAGTTPVRLVGGVVAWSDDYGWPLVDGDASRVTVEGSQLGGLRFEGPTKLDAAALDEVLRPARERGTVGGTVVFVQPDPALRPFWAVDGETHFAAIGEALAASPPGRVVRVAAGEYVESLVLSRAVTLAAASNDARVVVRSVDEPCLQVVDGAAAVVEGLALRFEKSRPTVNPAVMVDSGRLELRRCSVEVTASNPDLGPFNLKAVAFPDKGRQAEVTLIETTLSTDGIGVDAAGAGSLLRVEGVRIGPRAAAACQRGLWITSGVSARVVRTTFSQCTEAVRLEDKTTRLVLSAPVFERCEKTLNLVSADDGQVERD
ncbi:MAG: hypothetical protein H6825_15935 [Planctomycetes bacterium]|nr:hypothetical protein [Planctomycetota bacterium]